MSYYHYYIEEPTWEVRINNSDPIYLKVYWDQLKLFTAINACLSVLIVTAVFAMLILWSACVSHELLKSANMCCRTLPCDFSLLKIKSTPGRHTLMSQQIFGSKISRIECHSAAKEKWQLINKQRTSFLKLLRFRSVVTKPGFSLIARMW